LPAKDSRGYFLARRVYGHIKLRSVTEARICLNTVCSEDYFTIYLPIFL